MVQASKFLRNWLIPKRKNKKQWFLLMLLSITVAIAIAFWDVLIQSELADLGWQAWVSIAVTIAALLGNAMTTLPAEIVFLGALAVLLVTGILKTNAALAGFSNEGMVTVAVLYMVVTGLQQTGSLAWISQRVLGLPQGEKSALLRLMPPIIGLSAFLNNTPVVAMFIPVVKDWCRKLSISPSKLMIPLSYAAIFGGTCTLIGTSTNLVVNGLLIANTDHPGLKMFDITLVALPCVIAGTLFLYLAQGSLLPVRKPVIGNTDELRQYTVEMVVSPQSPLAGKSVQEAGLRHLAGLYLAEIVRGNQLLPAVSPQEVLRENDQLVFVGVVDSVIDLHHTRGLQPATDEVFKLDTPRTERCMIEAVVSNTCPLVKKTIREGQFRTRYNAVVLAVARNGERLLGKIGDIILEPGDNLLLEAHPMFLEKQRASKDFYLVSSIPDSEPLRHEKAGWAIAILVGMVVCAGFGWVPMLNASIVAAMMILLTGCCSPARSLQSIEWSVLVVIGAALGVGEALRTTGAAEAIAATCISIAGDNPWVVLAVVYAMTNLMTEVITNNAAAAIMFPISLALSQSLDTNILPFVITIMIAASASFSTPIGYQTNLMVYGPGGYKFTDFTRIGFPLNILFGIITVTLAPLIYPF
jgi:di/tricarboxylate transporter